MNTSPQCQRHDPATSPNFAFDKFRQKPLLQQSPSLLWDRRALLQKQRVQTQAQQIQM